MGIFGRLFEKKEKTAHEKLKEDLLNEIEVYARVMHYLSTCSSPFDERKFEELDGILEQAGVAFGSEKRAEMVEESKFILPSRRAGWRWNRDVKGNCHESSNSRIRNSQQNSHGNLTR